MESKPAAEAINAPTPAVALAGVGAAVKPGSAGIRKPLAIFGKQRRLIFFRLTFDTFSLAEQDVLFGFSITMRLGRSPGTASKAQVTFALEAPFDSALANPSGHLVAQMPLQRGPPGHELEAQPVVDHGEPAGR